MIRSSIHWLCSKSIHFLAVAIAACALLASRADGAAYTFIRIADSSGVFRDFPPVPAINNSGTVAFLAGLDNGPPGLFVGAGGDTEKIADIAGPISQFGLAPTINAGGVVGFTALMDNGEQRVFTGIGTGAGPVTITSTSGPLRTIGARRRDCRRWPRCLCRAVGQRPGRRVPRRSIRHGDHLHSARRHASDRRAKRQRHHRLSGPWTGRPRHLYDRRRHWYADRGYFRTAHLLCRRHVGQQHRRGGLSRRIG